MAKGNNRDVNLRIRAKDETGAGVKSAESALNRLAAAQKRTQARRDLYAGATQSTRELTAAYKAATDQATKFGRQMDDVKNWRWSKDVIDDPENLAQNFEQSRAAARRAKSEYLAAGAALAQMRGKQGGFAAFDQIATDAKKADRAIDGVTASLDQMNAAQRRASAAGRGGKKKGDLADQVTDAYGSRQGRGPLGLRPYEMQNLGYQVNDLVTQIASGTSPMQAFAQQGGQIAQIFPKATSAILRFSPAIAAAALIVSPFIVALKQMNDEAKRVSAVNEQLQASGNAAAYSKKDLVEYARNLADIGVKAEDVKGVVGTALREGLRPEYFDRFAQSARGLSKVTGDELTDSINTVTEAFTGNADEILALDDKIGFLSRSERKHIELLREQKKDVVARTEAFAIFERRYGSIAAKMDGPWDRILDNFGDAWGAFGRFMLSGIQWNAIKDEIGGILGLIDRLSARLPGVQQSGRDALAAQHSQQDREIRQLARVRGRNRNVVARGFAAQRGDQTAYMSDAQINARIKELERSRNDTVRQITAIDQTVRANQQRQQPTDTTIDPPDVANQDKPDTPKRDTEAERLAERQADYLEDLKAANAERAFEVTLIGKAEREAEILTEIEKQRAKAKDVGLTLSAEQEKAIRDSVGSLYDAEKAHEAIAKIEAARLSLAEKRNQVETRDAFIQRTLAAELTGATEEQRAAYTAILGQMYDLEAAKRRQTELEKALADQQARQQELQQQIQTAAALGNETLVAQLNEQLRVTNGSLLQAVQNMMAFWVAAGGPEADAALLKLQGLKANVEAFGSKAVVTGTQIDQMLSQGGANAFDQFAQSIVDGENAFESLRDAFLSFAADFLRQIALMIMQQAILNALGGGNGQASGTGGGIAGLISGLFRHSGGLVGTGGGFAPVNPMLFAGAMRYHGGGLAGLAPDEVPAILLRNEEVLTEDDPRHRNNGGLGGKGGSVKILNLFDAADALDRGLATEAGEQVFFNFVRRNAETFKALLG